MSPPDDAPRAAPETGTTLLRLEGRDALPLLHRLSTQSLEDLEPGTTRMTLFCDFRGRLLHRAAVAAGRDGAVWVARDDAPAAGLAEFLDRHVFREDVRIADAGAGLAVRAVPGGRSLAAALAEFENDRPRALQTDADFALVIEPAAGPAASPSPALEAARIRAGRPRHGHEIHEDFTPFEVGLAHEVHLHKGCFTGQEALMRLVTYRSVRRRLARLRGLGAAPTPRSAVTHEGAVVGRLTSVAGEADGWVALAVVRLEALEDPTRLAVEGAERLAEVEGFPETQPLGIALEAP
jgi:aminomethyltransferase